jgi:hypothetical protein
MNNFVIDTNIVKYILDGELWSQHPASLMRDRPELVVAYRHAQDLTAVANANVDCVALNVYAGSLDQGIGLAGQHGDVGLGDLALYNDF